MSGYDLIVIGGGPGGYVASIRAAQLGMKTACIDERATLGGTCLNVGCIPSKALLMSSEKFDDARSQLAQHGVDVGSVELNLAAMMTRKDKVVGDLTKGIDFLLKKNGVERIIGRASIEAPGRVFVVGANGDLTLEANAIIIATGSMPITLPGIEFDEKRIVSSTGALSLETVPDRMVVIGAGVIGLELGQVWARLGTQVTVVEFLDRILPGIDREIATTAQRALGRRRLKFTLGREVLGVEKGVDELKVVTRQHASGAQESLPADVVLVAVGRRPFTDGLGLDRLGVACDARGFIAVDKQFRTSCTGIYAIGDCVSGPMLAHKAEEDGVACVEMMAGGNEHPDYENVPSVVYTSPEIASVGPTEDNLRARGVDIAVGKFNFMANCRARLGGETEGLVKVVAEAASGRILGAHIVGPHASELIAEFVVAIARQATLRDVAGACHPHPSLSEALKEACLAALSRAIHA
ncbi:dihydrolipoyl dehydrogenase [Aminobacter niigataensis]|uniref:dihydrolipoyl dehydrogenase n=1 Tax=Aminobacter niigataensis TaxID=83265 RepID=UPI0024CDB41E|nr:dihydrolipoyl dehydrogenase [Aminobacter niigataensis]CAI2931826.1 Dihydrolipoyl dehydrogenase 3 [Aminobacter niigataensis]